MFPARQAHADEYELRWIGVVSGYSKDATPPRFYSNKKILI